MHVAGTTGDRLLHEQHFGLTVFHQQYRVIRLSEHRQLLFP
jgi:hypothetical protein